MQILILKKQKEFRKLTNKLQYHVQFAIENTAHFSSLTVEALNLDTYTNLGKIVQFIYQQKNY